MGRRHPPAFPHALDLDDLWWAFSSRSSPRSFPSAFWANWSASGRCWHSSSSAPACGSCADARPDLPRPFKTPLVPLVPILGILVSLGLMASLPLDTWLRLIIWLIIGMVIYFGYGRHHSRVQNMAADEVKVAGD